MSVDLRLPDLSSTPDLGCGAPGVATGVPCSQQCAGAAGDADCDGLPDPFDPVKATCNEALLIEDFVALQLDSARWTVEGSPQLGCGMLEISPTPSQPTHSLTLADGALLGAPGQRYLIELRVALQQLDVLQTGSWRVGLRTGVGRRV